MNGILDIFQSISNTEIPNLKDYVNALNEHQCFRLNDISAANIGSIQYITGLLSKPETRFQGLLLLEPLLQQTTLDVIEQKGNLWANLCLKICLHKGDDISIGYAYDALRLLIQKSVNIPELTKSFTSSLIGKICETYTVCHSNNYFAALKCLEQSLRLYPGQCGGNSRGVIEKFLIKFIDSDETHLVYLSGKCYHLLHQVRGGGVQGISQKTAWENYQIQLLGSLHNLLNLIYNNCVETYDESTENQELTLPELQLSTEPVKKAAQLIRRFKNISKYLIIAIREPFPVSKLFAPKKILNLISRGLGVNSESIRKNPISDNLAIGALLPDIHIQLFKVLHTMILVLKTHLTLYYKNILEVILNSLKWTSSGKSCGFSKPYKSLRIISYNTLTLWCKTMKFGSCVELYYEHFMKNIEYDIIPFQNEITLQVLSGAKKHMSKKARKQLHKAQNEKSHLAQSHSKSSDSQNVKTIYSDQENQSLCANALECLKEILVYASTLLKPILIKEAQIQIIQIAIHLKEITSSSSSKKCTLLYADPMCRYRLNDVLYALAMAPHHLCPPPVQLIIHLLAQNQILDPNALVRDGCAKNLQALEKILHPQKECLYFPPDINELKNALTEKQKNGEMQKLMEDASDSDSDEEDILTPIDHSQGNILIENNGESNRNQIEQFNSKNVIKMASEQQSQKDMVNSEIIKINDETSENENNIILLSDDDETVIDQTKFQYKGGKDNLDLSDSNKRKILSNENVSIYEENTSMEPITKKICIDGEKSQLIPQIENNSSSDETKTPEKENVDEDVLLNEIVSTFVDELNTD